MSNKRYGSIDKEDVVEDIVEKDDFVVVYNEPIVSDGKIIFSAEIKKENGLIVNGNLKISAIIQDENISIIKTKLEKIKSDTFVFNDKIVENKDWYK